MQLDKKMIKKRILNLELNVSNYVVYLASHFE
jgi:hypothetical protein